MTYRIDSAILFGGGGFIGTHLADHLLRTGAAQRIVVADLQPPPPERRVPGVEYLHCDVRQPISTTLAGARADLIVNLAAVHREPGHEAHEYFETNLRGAQNVCRYAEHSGCHTMVFTSSIAVYGPTEDVKTEESLPVPTTAYGASKLVAETMHVAWQRSRAENRLLIIRPGVVFGPGENGNVTRLIKSVIGRYFFFSGNHEVRKAGGYVRELCNAITWALGIQRERQMPSLLFNFSAAPTPRLVDFVEAVAAVADVPVPRRSVPFPPILAFAHVANAVGRVTRIRHPLHPVRVRKLVRSNNIVSAVLPALGYQQLFTLRSSLEDWKAREPSDWERGRRLRR